MEKRLLGIWLQVIGVGAVSWSVVLAPVMVSVYSALVLVTMEALLLGFIVYADWQDRRDRGLSGPLRTPIPPQEKPAAR